MCVHVRVHVYTCACTKGLAHFVKTTAMIVVCGGEALWLSSVRVVFWGHGFPTTAILTNLDFPWAQTLELVLWLWL